MYTLLFDIDGTLIDTAGAGGAGMRDAIVEAFGEPDAGRDLLADIPFAGRTDRAIVGDIFAAHGEPFTEDGFRTFLSHYVRRLPHTLAAKDGRVLPGVVDLLDALAGRHDVRLGLLTGNFRRGAELKLGHYGLADYFDFDTGGFGDTHLERNDVARMCRAAHEDAHGSGGVPADRLWVLGDTPADVACGRAIGANVLAVATGVHSVGDLEPSAADVLLDDLSDTAAVLALWPRGRGGV